MAYLANRFLFNSVQHFFPFFLHLRWVCFNSPGLILERGLSVVGDSKSQSVGILQGPSSLLIGYFHESGHLFVLPASQCCNTVTDRGLSQLYLLISIWSATALLHKTMQYHAISNQLYFPPPGLWLCSLQTKLLSVIISSYCQTL